MIEVLKQMPSWAILLVLFIAYYIRPDNVTEDLLKGVSGALLLSLRSSQPTPTAP